MIALAIDIRNKKVNTLVCHCINAGNYQPVGDGMEQCHAEILYKACLEIQRYLQERRDKEASLCLDEIR